MLLDTEGGSGVSMSLGKQATKYLWKGRRKKGKKTARQK